MPLPAVPRFRVLPLLLLTACLSLGGCVTDTNKMKALVGKDKQQLFVIWGTPNQVVPTASGGQEWIYRDNAAVGYGVYAKTRVFVLDKNGIVTGWRWKGL